MSLNLIKYKHQKINYMKQSFLLISLAMTAAITSYGQISAPEGEIQYYQRSGSYLAMDWMGPVTETQSGVVGVVQDGSDIYFQNLIQQLNNENWLHGTIADDGKTVTIDPDNKITATSQWFEGEDGIWYEHTGWLKAVMLSYVPAHSEYEMPTFVEIPDMPITLTIEDNTVSLCNSSETCVLGAILTGFGPDHDGAWSVGADFGTVLKPFDEAPVTVPAEAVGQSYIQSSTNVYSYDVTNAYVTLYTLGDDVYIQGIDPERKQFAIKGTRQGDNLHFEGPQFVGIWSGYIYEITGTIVSRSEPDEWGWSDVTTEDVSSFDLIYDEATGGYKLDSNMAIRVYSRGSQYSGTLLSEYSIAPYDDVLLTPQEPLITDVANYWELEGDWGVFFSFETTSVEGKFLNTEHLSYCFYINGELYTFPAELYELDEDLTEIPYTLTGNAFLNRITYFGVQNYIQVENIWKIGLQLIYRVGDEVSYSTINEFQVADDPTSICTLKSATDDAHYDLFGRRVSADYRGLIVK